MPKTELQRTDLADYLAGIERLLRWLGNLLMALAGALHVGPEDPQGPGELGFLLCTQAEKLRLARGGLCPRCAHSLVLESAEIRPEKGSQKELRVRESQAICTQAIDRAPAYPS